MNAYSNMAKSRQRHNRSMQRISRAKYVQFIKAQVLLAIHRALVLPQLSLGQIKDIKNVSCLSM